MRTVITAESADLQAKFDLRFGRAAYFCVVDENSGTTEFFENPYIEASNGAGTKVAEKMVELKVDKVISGDFGPKAKDLLQEFNIQMVILESGDTSIEKIIEKLKG
jgi:predicted Fe-Mo cluster-binding NifX family protein